jgi:hypothetical protein
MRTALGKLVREYERHKGLPVTSLDAQKLEELLADYGETIVLEAFEVTAKSARSFNLKYVEGVCRSLLADAKGKAAEDAENKSWSNYVSKPDFVFPPLDEITF